MSDWKSYLYDREIRTSEHGFYVIRPSGSGEPTPVSCKLCHRMIRTSEDESSARDFSCCYLCALRWAHPRRIAWGVGWRPSDDEVARELSQRPGLTVHIKIE